MKIKIFAFAISLIAMCMANQASAYSCNNSHKPIVMVHGWLSGTYAFNTMKNYLEDRGYSTCKMYTFGYNYRRDSNKTSASRLSSYVNSVSNANGGKKVTIIAHSNGGLVSRWYRAKLGGYSKNDRFIALGTPHRGTSSAYACFDAACYDMRPNSSFLRSLGGSGCQYSIWTNEDIIVIPYSSSQCGSNYRVPGYASHNGLLTDSDSLNIVRYLTPKY